MFLIKSDSNHLLCANIRACWPFKRKHTSCPLLIFYADSLKTTMCDYHQPENCTEALIDGNVLVLFRSLPVKSEQNWNQRKGSTLKAALCWHIAAKFSTYRIQLALGLLLACSFPLGVSPQNIQYARRSFTIYGVNLKRGSVFGVNSWNWHCVCLSGSLFFPCCRHPVL